MKWRKKKIYCLWRLLWMFTWKVQGIVPETTYFRFCRNWVMWSHGLFLTDVPQFLPWKMRNFTSPTLATLTALQLPCSSKIGEMSWSEFFKRPHFILNAVLQKTDQVITVLSRTIRPYIKISNNFSSDNLSNHKDNHREAVLFTDCSNQK